MLHQPEPFKTRFPPLDEITQTTERKTLKPLTIGKLQ